MTVVALSPAQQDVLDVLGASPDERPRFPADLRQQLRAELEAGLDDVAAQVGEAGIRVTKHDLSSVHGCQERFLADAAQAFEWTPPRARGTVAHKAIELSVHWRGAPTPLDLVDEAVARLAEADDGLATWLQALPEAVRAELRAEANDRVAKFLECWPPLSSRWRPVTESRLRVDLCGDRITLVGKVDLTLGRPSGDRAGKVLVDLKTGGVALAHVDDLRFYALVETLRLGTPPRRVASHYLDSGRFVSEDVTEGALWSAVRRTVDGVRAMVELRGGQRPPSRHTGPPCRWCPLLGGCADGRSFLDALDDG
jgi:hypothetical protein